MFKVKLRDNLRYFETDDSDFIMKAGEVRELPPRMFRSFEIRGALYYGRLKLAGGDCLFGMKNARLYFSALHPDFCFGLEASKFFKRDLDADTITFVKDEEVPEDVREFLKAGELPADRKPAPIPKPKDEPRKEDKKSEEKPEAPKEEVPEKKEEAPEEKEPSVPKDEPDFDLNKDGKVDDKDRSLAGKLLASKKGKKDKK